MKKPQIRTILKCIISGILIYYLVTHIKLSDLKTIYSIKSVIYLEISVIVFFTSLIMMSIRWQIILNTIFKRKLSLTQLLKNYIMGLFFDIIIPGSIGGDISRTNYLVRSSKIKITKSIKCIILERASGILGLITLLSAGIVLANQDTASKLGAQWYYPLISISLIMISAIVFKKYLITIKTKEVLIILILSIISQFGDIISALIFCKLMNQDITIIQLMLIIPIVHLASIIPIAIGGLGIRENTMASLLSIFGINFSTGAIISILMYFTRLVIAIVGFFFYIIDPHQSKKDLIQLTTESTPTSVNP